MLLICRDIRNWLVVIVVDTHKQITPMIWLIHVRTRVPLILTVQLVQHGYSTKHTQYCSHARSIPGYTITPPPLGWG